MEQVANLSVAITLVLDRLSISETGALLVHADATTDNPIPVGIQGNVGVQLGQGVDHLPVLVTNGTSQPVPTGILTFLDITDTPVPVSIVDDPSHPITVNVNNSVDVTVVAVDDDVTVSVDHPALDEMSFVDAPSRASDPKALFVSTGSSPVPVSVTGIAAGATVGVNSSAASPVFTNVANSAASPVNTSTVLAPGTTVGVTSLPPVALVPGTTVALPPGTTVGLSPEPTVVLAPGATVQLAPGTTVGLAPGTTVTANVPSPLHTIIDSGTVIVTDMPLGAGVVDTAANSDIVRIGPTTMCSDPILVRPWPAVSLLPAVIPNHAVQHPFGTNTAVATGVATTTGPDSVVNLAVSGLL